MSSLNIIYASCTTNTHSLQVVSYHIVGHLSSRGVRSGISYLCHLFEGMTHSISIHRSLQALAFQTGDTRHVLRTFSTQETSAGVASS